MHSRTPAAIIQVRMGFKHIVGDRNFLERSFSIEVVGAVLILVCGTLFEASRRSLHQVSKARQYFAAQVSGHR